MTRLIMTAKSGDWFKLGQISFVFPPFFSLVNFWSHVRACVCVCVCVCELALLLYSHIPSRFLTCYSAFSTKFYHFWPADPWANVRTEWRTTGRTHSARTLAHGEHGSGSRHPRSSWLRRRCSTRGLTRRLSAVPRNSRNCFAGSGNCLIRWEKHAFNYTYIWYNSYHSIMVTEGYYSAKDLSYTVSDRKPMLRFFAMFCRTNAYH